MKMARTKGLLSMNKNKITRLNNTYRTDKESVPVTPVADTNDEREPVPVVLKPDTETVDVAKLQKLEAKNDGKKFTYAIGWKDDSGLVTLFDNAGTVFYGTQEDAEGLLAYANRTDGGPDWEIIKIG